MPDRFKVNKFHIEQPVSTRVQKPVEVRTQNYTFEIGQNLLRKNTSQTELRQRILSHIQDAQSRRSHFCPQTRQLMQLKIPHETKIGELAQKCLNDSIIELNITKAEYDSLDHETKLLVDRYTQMRFKSCNKREPSWSWCAIAMNDLGKQAGILPQNANFTAVFQHVQFAVDNRTWHEVPKGQYLGKFKSDMKEGDFIVFHRPDHSEHIGMIELVSGDTITTIEGNANQDNQNINDGFIRKQYKLSELTGSNCRGFIDNHSKPDITGQNTNAAKKANSIVKH